MKSRLTIEMVREALGYDPETGILTWKLPLSNRVQVGARAGVIAQNGRRYINLHGEKHLAHRLAWFHHYGVWPIGDIRQMNGNYDDCSIENIIEQSRAETASNRRVNVSSKSGHAGVTWSERDKRWQAHITRDYKQVFIGLFDTVEAAVAARQEAVANWNRDVTQEQRASAAHSVARRRRQRVAWQKMNALGVKVAWASFDAFAADVGDLPETKMAIVRIDDSMPIGPGNWRWSLPPDKKHDFRTRDGRISYNRAHRAENPDHYRDKELRRTFGITLTQYRAKLAEQGGVCAVCGSDEVAERNGKALALAVDHDHDTDELRGILCISCNTGIGKLRDDPKLLRRAAEYLVSHGKRNPLDPSIIEAMKRSPHRDWLILQEPAGHG